MKTLYGIVFLFSLLISVHSQWVPLGGSLGGDMMELAVFNSNLYVGGFTIFRSTNNGNNWTSQIPNSQYTWSLASSGPNFYCGVMGGGMSFPSGVYRSTNNGLNWHLFGLADKVISDIVADDQKIIANSIIDGKIYETTNAGSNWFDIRGSLSLGIQVLAISGSRIYAGAQGLHMTTNNGVNWSPIFMSDNIEAIAVSDSLVLIGTTGHGVYRSTNYGQNWERTLNIDRGIRSVYLYGSYAFAGADTGFYVSSNAGLSFTDYSQGLGNASISSIIIHNNYVFVTNARFLSTNVSAYRRPLQEVFGISQISTEIPSGFRLSQNYPNPFNPSTKIRFDIPANSQSHDFDLRLIIYDILGREAATLVDESLKPGTYEVDWDGTKYPSGVYFYQISSENFIQTKRMVLLK